MIKRYCLVYVYCRMLLAAAVSLWLDESTPSTRGMISIIATLMLLLHNFSMLYTSVKSYYSDRWNLCILTSQRLKRFFHMCGARCDAWWVSASANVSQRLGLLLLATQRNALRSAAQRVCERRLKHTRSHCYCYMDTFGIHCHGFVEK